MGAYALWRELLDDTAGGWNRLSQWRTEAKPEGTHLDFKQGAWVKDDVRDDDRKNLAKGISGFANVDGGLLVFGAETTRGAGKEEVLSALTCIDPLDLYAAKLETYIKDSTTPVVPGIDIRKFADPASPSRGVVVVYIPFTEAGPFRAEGPKPDVSGRYFVRTTSATAVMPHQMLAAMFGRRPPPQLRVGIERRDDTYLTNVHVENVGQGAAAGTFVRLKVRPGQSPDSINAIGSWTNRRADVIGVGWDLAFAHPAGELLYPGESRLAGVYRQTVMDERPITVRVDCANAPPVRVTRTVKLELNRIEWFAAPEINASI